MPVIYATVAPTIESKICPDCGTNKSAEDFGKNKRTKSGLANYCKICTATRNRVQYLANQERRKRESAEYRQENAAAIAERAKQKRLTDEYKTQRREYLVRTKTRRKEQEKAWRDRNPGYHTQWRARVHEHRLAWEAQHREANRERYNGWARGQRENDPERFRRAKHKYRAAKQANGSIPYTSEQWVAKFDYWGRRCWICCADLTHGRYDIDHVKPLNKGGMDCLSNLRPSCPGCNRSKRDRWPYTPKRALKEPDGRHS